MRSHDLTVGTSRADGEQVATLGTVEVDLLGKDVCRLTDRTYDIVCLCRFFTGDILNLMVGLIEGRTNQVGESCIDDGELLHGSFFYK